MPFHSPASQRRTRTTQRLSLLALENRITPVRFRAPVTEAAAPVAAVGELWQRLDAVPPAPAGKQSYLGLDHFLPVALDAQALDGILDAAPAEAPGWNNSSNTVLTLPAPDGHMQRFRIVNAPIMEPGLAAQFPDIRTFRGQGIDDPTASLAMDFTPQGFHAQVLTPNGSWYIDPYYHLDQGIYASYSRSDMNASKSPFARGFYEAGLEPGPAAASSDDGSDPPLANRTGATLRTYRTVVAATGEYTAFFGGTVANGQAAIVTAMNRVSGVYEVELTIRLTLVANNSSVVYTNAATDPYTNNNGGAMLGQNQSNLDSVIGNANYDIGHVFSTGGGGVASLGVVGITGNKARGVTGSPSPVGDAFTIDYVAHEMGHQFRGNHSFNTSSDPNRNASTAYEPGSGSTIMSYAGITGPNSDLQAHSDAYFHSISFDEIINFVDNTIPGVGTRTATGNLVPTVTATTAGPYTIPTGTPFALTAQGTDGNGDTLTYNWEQRNLGPANLLNSADNGSSPLFRSLNSSTNPTRYFPRLTSILSNSNPSGNAEKLPTVNWPGGGGANPMRFRVTVRDNRAGGGGVNTAGGTSTSDAASIAVSVVNTGAAFTVTSPNALGITYAGGSTQTVTWNVAGTASAPINAALVNVRLVTTNGAAFTSSTVLASSVPNDGSESVQMPYNLGTNQARIIVEPVGNVFFDISNFNFTITNVAPPSAPQVTGVGVNNGTDVQRSRVTSLTVAFNSIVTLPAVPETAFTVNRAAPGGGGGPVTFTASASNGTGVTIVTLSNFTGTNADFGSLADGVYTVGVIASLVTGSGGTQLDGNGDGTPGDDYSLAGTQANGLYRLFGDSTGDGATNAIDLGQFRNAIGTVPGDPNYRDYLDFDASSAVNAFDFGQFRNRFGINLFP